MTANEQLQDEAITHALYLQGYTKGTTSKILQLLKRTHNDLVSQLEVQLERLPQNEFNIARIDALLTPVNALIRDAYANVSGELNTELKGLTAYETGYQSQLFQNILPEQVAFITVTGEQAYAAAMARPFQGKLLSEWMAGLDADLAAKVRDAVRMGYVEGQTVGEMVRRIRGTRALSYADGLLDINYRNAETIVRTAISHTASYARDLTYAANDDIVKGIKWLSTLDSRTTPICQVRDGLVYTVKTHKPVGHGYTWLGGPGRAHMNCRSSSTVVLKSWREMGIDADEADASTRASLDGQVPADTTYAQWLKGKGAKLQDEVLGKTRGELFRSGKIELDKFYAKDMRTYTIDELRALNPAAFAKKQYNFTPSENLTAYERKIETDFFNEIRNNEAGLIRDYRKQYGNIVDPDLAKRLNAAFRDDLSLVSAVHEPSSYMAKSIFTDALNTKKRLGDTSPTIFTAGGSGSGKSATMPKAIDALGAKKDGLVLDSVLSNFKSATSKIDEALRIADGDVAIVYTNTPLETAFGFNALRARSVDIPTLSHAHIGASNTIRELQAHYANNPRVKVLIMNNSGLPADVKFGTLSDVPKYDPQQATKNLTAIAQRLLDEGKIDKNKFTLLIK